jgi:hypothetical protein
VERTCGTCHGFPAPELFPKDRWPREVERGFKFLAKGTDPPATPNQASVVAYYHRHAPAELTVLDPKVLPTEGPARFERTGYRAPGGRSASAVAYL